jgi:tyrosine-protein kinase Etk/Wzc
MDTLTEPFHDEPFDIRELLFKFSGYWYWFVICISISLIIAYAINYLTVPIYDVKTSILIQDEKKILDERFSSGLGIGAANNRLPSEIAILKTRTITHRVIQQLDFRIAYFSFGKFGNKELYKDSPFIIATDSATVLPLNIPIEITILSANKYSVKAEAENAAIYSFYEKRTIDNKQIHIDTSGTIYTPIHNHGLSFTIASQKMIDLKSIIGRKYSFVVYDDNTLINQFRNFYVSDNKSASILTISIQGANIQKLVDFLNVLSAVYLEKGIEKKNQMAENTIRFIDSQLGGVGDSLFFSEKNLQNYRISQNVMDVDMQVQQSFSAIENLKQKRSELIVNSKYFNYLKHFLETNNDIKDLASPSTLDIKDLVLNNLMNDLVNLYNERSELTFNSKKDNPFLLSNEQKIKNVKESVIKAVNNLLNATSMALQEMDNQLKEISETVNRLPETQRKLVGYERKFKLNDALYTYLLTKRSEIQIAKSSYLPDNEILDEANSLEAVPVSPNKKSNIIIALIWGIAIPAVIILLKNLS